MPVELQVKLLRVLETSDVLAWAGQADQGRRAHHRRHQPPASRRRVAAGKLREDLHYRLNVFPIPLPPLRDRGDDVELLAEQFLAELNAAEGTAKHLTPAARERLRRHNWPGNVRELKNVIRRAFILAEEELGRRGSSETRPAKGSAASLTMSVGTPLVEAERRLILATLDQFDGDKKKAASALKISLKTLYTRLNEYKSH